VSKVGAGLTLLAGTGLPIRRFGYGAALSTSAVSGDSEEPSAEDFSRRPAPTRSGILAGEGALSQAGPRRNLY